jgi:hypothetical protein
MLRLTAADAEDLSIISAQMQDALMQRADLRFDQKRCRFAFVANRFAWDAMPEKQRRRAGIHFDDVEAVQAVGLASLPADAVLSLLAITPESNGALAGTITLSFSAGIRIRLKVACINVTLADLGGTWEAALAPSHEP